jgi:RNA recognition motif-containing protein
MTKNIYVGNISYQTTEEELNELFSEYGTVQSAKIISDRETGRNRGFAFVEMDDAGADEAIKNLNNTEFGGRTLKVNEARERKTEFRPRRTEYRR